MTPKKYTLIIAFTAILLSNNISCMHLHRLGHIKKPTKVEKIDFKNLNSMQTVIHEFIERHKEERDFLLTKKEMLPAIINKNSNTLVKRQIARMLQSPKPKGKLEKVIIQFMHHHYKNHQKIFVSPLITLFPELEDSIVNNTFADEKFDTFIRNIRIHKLRAQTKKLKRVKEPIPIQDINMKKLNKMQIFVHHIIENNLTTENINVQNKINRILKDKKAKRKFRKAIIQFIYYAYNNNKKLASSKKILKIIKLFPDIEKIITQNKFADEKFDHFMQKRRIHIIKRLSHVNSKINLEKK